jgi:hypothetical protein
MLLVTAALFAVLRIAAAEGRNSLEEGLADQDLRPRIEGFVNLPAATIAANIGHTAMEIWPLHWPRVNAFLGLLMLGIVCFIFYRLALVWVAVQILALLRIRSGD